ncbi:hypothetical protein ACSBR1_034677 [Camellia fascicularis]
MAQVSIVLAFVIAVFFTAAAMVVSAQDTAMTPAPAPDTGAAFSVPMNVKSLLAGIRDFDFELKS